MTRPSRLTQQEQDDIAAQYVAGEKMAYIAAIYNTSVSNVLDVVRRRYRLPARPHPKNDLDLRGQLTGLVCAPETAE